MGYRYLCYSGGGPSGSKLESHRTYLDVAKQTRPLVDSRSTCRVCVRVLSSTAEIARRVFACCVSSAGALRRCPPVESLNRYRTGEHARLEMVVDLAPRSVASIGQDRTTERLDCDARHLATAGVTNCPLRPRQVPECCAHAQRHGTAR